MSDNSNDFAIALATVDATITKSLEDYAKGSTSMTDIGRAMAQAVVDKIYPQDAATATARVIGLKSDAFASDKVRDTAKSQLKNFATIALLFPAPVGMAVIDKAIAECKRQYKPTVDALVKIKNAHTTATAAKVDAAGVGDVVAKAVAPKVKKEKPEATPADTGNAIADNLNVFCEAQDNPHELLEICVRLNAYVKTLGLTTAQIEAANANKDRDAARLEALKVSNANRKAAKDATKDGAKS